MLPGDVLYIHTGWSAHWQDPDAKKTYYTKGPSLSHHAAQFLRKKAVLLVALDNTLTDPVFDGQLIGKQVRPEGTRVGLPIAIHHKNLAVSGIPQNQNAKLVKDQVWTSCNMILPLQSKGGSGSPVRAVAIGAPA